MKVAAGAGGSLQSCAAQQSVLKQAQVVTGWSPSPGIGLSPGTLRLPGLGGLSLVHAVQMFIHPVASLPDAPLDGAPVFQFGKTRAQSLMPRPASELAPDASKALLHIQHASSLLKETLGYLLNLIKRSSTCRERVTEVEEAFISKVRASYVCITYQMRPPSRAGCSPGLYPDIESELRPRCGSAARQKLAHGPDWP